MLRKIISLFILTCLLLLCTCGCVENNPIDNPSNEKYALRQESGRCYLIPNFAVPDASSSANGSVSALKIPSFSSIAEMKEKIVSGEIPEEELKNMLLILGYKNDDKKVEICDPEKLYDIALPEGVLCNEIYWQGTEYGYSLQFDNSIRGYVDLVKRSNLENKCSWILSGQDYVFSDETIADRNARAIHYKNSSGEYKKFLYTLSSDCGSVLVEELYVIDDFSDSAAPNLSAKTPNYISLYGTHNSAYFYGWLTDITERPSVEWLKGFGLKEFGWQADDRDIATLPELIRTYPDRFNGTNLSFPETVDIEIWYPDRCPLPEEESAVDKAIEEKTNTALDFVNYSEISQYETRIARQMIPELTYHDDLYFGNEFGPYGAYIDWYDYLHQLPNVRAALTNALTAAYENEDGCLYHLPVPGTENGSWTASNLLESDELENLLRFVDWLYSEEGKQMFPIG